MKFKKEVIIGMFLLFVSLSFVSAGVGIKWSQESALINEGEKTCMTYNVYNPWPEESYVQIELSDELTGILTMQEAETKFIPANTPSSEAIPVEFCFKVPSNIYEKDCLIGNSFICAQSCEEERVEYSGEVLVKSVPPPTSIDGSGGSVTQMSVSAPLNVRIQCNAHERSYMIIYVLIAGLSLVIIGLILFSKYRKPKAERDREQLKKLREEIKKESKRG